MVNQLELCATCNITTYELFYHLQAHPRTIHHIFSSLLSLLTDAGFRIATGGIREPIN